MIAAQMSGYIREKQINLSTLAGKAGVDAARLERLLRGEGEMSIDEYAALCQALGVPYQLFFDRDRQTAEV